MTAPASDKKVSIRKRAVTGSLWSFSNFGFETATRLGSNLILTRLLTPEVFGLMALARIAVSLLTLISDIGTKASIIRSERGDDLVFLQTAWTMQVLRGCIIFLGACLLSWPLSVLYDQPVLFPLICVLAISPLIAGFRSLSETILNRKIMLARVTLLAMALQLVTTMLTIAFAWYLQSVWALAIAGVFGALFSVVASYVFLPAFDHRFRLERDAVREIVGFGKWILIATLLTYFSGRGIQAINGLLIPVETLGFISLAGMLAWAPGQLVQRLMGAVTFPVLAEIGRENADQLAAAVRKTKYLLVAVPMPLFAILHFFGPLIVEILYDERYARAGVFLSIMALNGALGVLPMPYQNLMLALGNSRIHAIVMGVAAVSKISGLLVGFYLAGEIGMLVGIGIGNILPLGISLWYARNGNYSQLPMDLFITVIICLGYWQFL